MKPSITYIPLPGPRDVNIPALISLQLPPDVKSGQVYTVTVQQYSGLPRRIIGSLRQAVLDSKRDDTVRWEIIFNGENLEAPAVWCVRDGLIPRKKVYVE